MTKKILLLGDSLLCNVQINDTETHQITKRFFPGATVGSKFNKKILNAVRDFRYQNIRTSDQFFVVLAFGTNNLINKQKQLNQNIDEFVLSYQRLVGEILKVQPHKILVTSLLPRGDVHQKKAVFVEANKKLKNVFNEQSHIQYVTTYRTFLEKSQPILKYYKHDKLHLNDDGSERLSEVLAEIIRFL